MSLDLISNVVFWSTLPSTTVAFLAGYLSHKEYMWCQTFLVTGPQVFFEAAQGHSFQTTIWCLLTWWNWWLYKRDDDNDKGRKKRKAALNKIPRPHLVKIRPVGAT